MKTADIQQLMASFDKTNISYMKLKLEHVELVFDKASSRKVAPAPVGVASNVLHTPIQSPTATACALNTTTGATSHANNPTSTKEDYILSPMVGTFYHRPSPSASPYVSPGDTIKKGQVIGIVEAMKIMNEIEAECDCKILSIEVEDATAVEYGTQLVKIEKL
ncbi:acetyl-CoA carboxylase biotin carboxyl carrier protein [Helicobacter bizzozeronii]|uniref:Biotin carboxyl carrier protein of acetyl-CoA carboxylase n=1 Tax=Helicobacter bizzozeronii (strain CIII-1) TaxID=1002804 RepID=F8KPZ3_HELBC|nr:acetyl-CoA carboxylase biotin carboxyl carrier protein [Helicobacter bizzozeronii]CCB79146.1 biotin carboxyl carrier protein of acetyl-CoA carboxylase [Helicobacter bizzozeronii CIII-1]